MWGAMRKERGKLLMKICDSFTPVQDDFHVCNNCGNARMKHDPPYKVADKSAQEILDELSAEMTDKDWEDWNKSAKIARKIRVRCNKMTKTEREASFAAGMRIIYGHKWTKQKPMMEGWYWVKDNGIVSIEYIFKPHGKWGYFIDDDCWCKLDKGLEYAGPLGEPS